MRYIYQVQIDIIFYQIYQLVGGFSAKFVSLRIIQNIFFHMIGNKSFHFIFWEGGVSESGLYLYKDFGKCRGSDCRAIFASSLHHINLKGTLSYL